MMSIDRNNRLIDLAERVKQADLAMIAAAKEFGLRAVEAGRLLVEAKAECPHGQWLPFLDKAGVKERQAQRPIAIVNAGLTSDTVSDLGMRGALDLASQRKLPPSGSALVAWVGEPLHADWPVAIRGQATAWVFEAERHPGFWHVVALADFEKGSEASWTKKPYSQNAEALIFKTVDMVMNWRQSETSFQVVLTIEDGVGIAASLRDGFIEDAGAA